MKKFIILFLFVFAVSLLTGCSDADLASHNLSKEADMFRINRRIVFYNGITDAYILVIQGKCSLGNSDKSRELSVTCKTSHTEYKKHFLGLSDNVTFFVEQLDPMPVDIYHYKVIFKPQVIIPDIDLSVK
ncbi:MAG: hypothetical protein A2161_13735 [Candidatus Schekmanbacteria bacterium RBG_13_48_7]|uniref:PrcB C-terminal domain-containing protein n=1 Tax=Candidatus Schekmanbacteria bacterium RBG_13_48_7 TaxID=1817878 RepID=A0A1F7RZM3_9BACT|nr:MAG: hypothetical protein A2161_13735 [Candidatus Schekmanbacteria bacterium RBG_13_48_7]